MSAPTAQPVTTPAVTLAALALMLQAAKLEAHTQGYQDAQPTQSYADAKAGAR